MKNKEKGLTTTEKAILNAMYFERRYMSAKEIAKKTFLSWQTVEKYLKRLGKRKFVKRTVVEPITEYKSEKVRYKWCFNYEYYKKLLKEKGL